MKNKSEKLKISVHFSFIILIALAFFAGLHNLILLYFLSLVLHEFVHAIVAKKLGYQIGKINLMITGAVLEAESDEFSFEDEIKISISAPLFNLCVCVFILSLWWIKPEIYNYTQDLFVINLSIFAFNILPIFPLDGGRVLLGILSKYNDRKNACLIAKCVAILLCLFIFILFIVSLFISPNFSLGITALMLFISAITEDKKAVYKKVMFIERKKRRIEKKGVEIKYVLVNNKADKKSLLKLTNARFFTIFLVVDDNLKVINQIQENELFE